MIGGTMFGLCVVIHLMLGKPLFRTMFGSTDSVAYATSFGLHVQDLRDLQFPLHSSTLKVEESLIASLDY